MSEKDLKGKYSGSITGDVTLTNSTPSANGELGYDPAQGFLGYHNGAVGPIGGGDTSMEIVDNDSNADGTVILKAGSRWLNGRVATNASDITTAAPSSGSDDTIRDLDGSTGLRAETSVTIRNYVYWDMINDKYVTISNASDAAKQAYDSTSRTINTTEYAPIGYVDVAESGGAHTLTVENYPNQSWDSYKELQAADGWQDWTPTITGSGSMTWTTDTLYFARYRRVGAAVEMKLSVNGTTGGTASPTVLISLPIAPNGSGLTETMTTMIRLGTGTNLLAGASVYDTFNSRLNVRKIDGTSWSLGAGREIIITGFYEIDADLGYNVIATPATEFDWRSANLVQKTTGADITSSDPIGTFVAYKWDASNNRTIDTTTLTQSIDDIKANGFRIYARARNVASTAGLPPQIQIKVAEAGAGIGSFHVDGYGSTSFGNALNYSRFTGSAAPAIGFGTGVFFSKDSGTIVLDAGNKLDTETGTARVGYSAADVSYTNGYFTVKASATTPLVGLPKLHYQVEGTTTTGIGNNVVTDITGASLDLPAGRYNVVGTYIGEAASSGGSVTAAGVAAYLRDASNTVLTNTDFLGSNATSSAGIFRNQVTVEALNLDWPGGVIKMAASITVQGTGTISRSTKASYLRATRIIN